jgi:hypothetical protein
MAHRELTLKDQLKGVRAALKSRKTPKQFRAALERRAAQLQEKLQKRDGGWGW